MGGYATMQTRLWSETATWPADAKLLFIWTWTNDHVHGVTGIGKVPDVVIAAETGLDGARLKRAKRFIAQVKKVLWFEDNWYWVVGRMRHTVFANAEHANPSLFIAATKYFAEHRVPQALAKELGATYPQLGTTLASGCIHTPPHPADVPNPNPNPNPNPGTPHASPQGGDSPFDSFVLPFWRECVAKGWLKDFKEGSEEFENSRKRINRAWPGKHGIGAVWEDFKRELPTARFVTETWKPGFILLTRRNRAGTLHRVCVATGEYQNPGPGSKPPKPEFLQVGDEYDNIARKVDDDNSQDN